MQGLVLTFHILACLVLIILVLLQQGKEGMGVIFGGGSQSVFGSSGAGGLLTKLTAAIAALFLVTSLSYNILSKDAAPTTSTIMDAPEISLPADQQPAPAAPEESRETKEPAVQIEETGGAGTSTTGDATGDATADATADNGGVQIEETGPAQEAGQKEATN